MLKTEGEIMTPMQWALRPLKKFAVFSGRAPRAEYWWFYLLTLAISFLSEVIDKATDTSVAGIVLNLGVIIPWIAVSVRRLHDIDRTGWWMLLLTIPFVFLGMAIGMSESGAPDPFNEMTGLMIVGIIAMLGTGITLLVFMVTEGTGGPNRFGDDPYGPSNLEEVFA